MCQSKDPIGIQSTQINNNAVVSDDSFKNRCYVNFYVKDRLVHNTVQDCVKSQVTKLQTNFSGPFPAKYCRFNGCKNTSNDVGINFFPFPKGVRCQAWVEACQDKSLIDVPAADLQNVAHVCHEHFQDWCFIDINNKHTLVENAIPNCSKLWITDDLISSKSVAVKQSDSSFSSTSKNSSCVIGELFVSPFSIYEPSALPESAAVNELNSTVSSTLNNHSCVVGELFLSPVSIYEPSTVSEIHSAKVSSVSSSVLANAAAPKVTNSSVTPECLSQTKTLTPTLVHSTEMIKLKYSHLNTSTNISPFLEEGLIYPVSEEELNAICEPEQSISGTNRDCSSVDISAVAETSCNSPKYCTTRELPPVKLRLLQKVEKYSTLLENLQLELSACEKKISTVKS